MSTSYLLRQRPASPWKSSTSWLSRLAAISQYFSSISMPIALHFQRDAAIRLEPLPQNGSKTVQGANGLITFSITSLGTGDRCPSSIASDCVPSVSISELSSGLPNAPRPKMWIINPNATGQQRGCSHMTVSRLECGNAVMLGCSSGQIHSRVRWKSQIQP